MTGTAAALRGNWNYPTQIRLGVGRIAELGRVCPQRSQGVAANEVPPP